MKIVASGFEWDDGNWPKCAKHGVSKDEIEEIFHLTPAILPDPHPDEPRMRAIGKTEKGRYVFLVFSFRLRDGRNVIRPISARYMHKKEIDHYEKSRA